jgi:hypothetical protein
MVVLVEKVGDNFVLPLQAVQELGLVDGCAIEISKAETGSANRYASVDEVMKTHREMEPFHADAYRELAK